MSVVEARYAQALLSLTTDKASASAAESALQEFVTIFENDSAFKELLCNPLIIPKRKHEVVKKVCSDAPELIQNFLMLLIDKFRIDLVSGIYKQYVELCDARENIAHMIISSVLPLEPSEIEQIQGFFKKKLSLTDMRVQTKLDASLLGGVRVVIGDKVFDGSIRAKLISLKGAISDKLASVNIN